MQSSVVLPISLSYKISFPGGVDNSLIKFNIFVSLISILGPPIYIVNILIIALPTF